MIEDIFYTAKNDRSFKDIFMNEKNKDILKCLLENILNVSIEDINYSNLERPVIMLKLDIRDLIYLLETLLYMV